MKNYTYNFEIKDLLTQFVSAFDDIVIKRYDDDRNVRELIEVRYVFAPKQRVIYDIENKAQNLTLPVVAVNVTGISRDESRVFNKLDSVYNSLTNRGNTKVKMPIPVNISVSMSMIARYMTDMDQILSNFIPYNNPYIIISWKEPTTVAGQDIEIRSEVLWSGNISLSNPIDLTSATKYRIVADTNFTIKGWLFRDQNETGKQIYFIDTNFIASNNMIISDDDYDTFFNSLSENTETISISATPDITNIFYATTGIKIEVNDTLTFSKNLSTNSVLLYGKNFSSTTAVLLSSNTFTTGLTSYKPIYSQAISGRLVPPSNYQILTDNIISINIPHIPETCVYDILISNVINYSSTYQVNSFSFNNS